MSSQIRSGRALRAARSTSRLASNKLNGRGGAVALRLLLCALVGCVALCVSAGGAAAATLTVNSTADGAIANDGACTLREAVTNANGDNQSGSTDCAAGSGADTITFSVTGTITLTSGLPTITTPLTISGPGAAQLTVSGNNAVRVFFVSTASPNVVAFTGLTIASGNAGNGGGILNNSTGTINVTNSTLSGNSTGGGGIYRFGGTVNLGNSIVAKSTATHVGPDLLDTFTSQGYNLVGIKDANATITATTGDQFGTTAAPIDPKLDTLQNNGGPVTVQVSGTGSSRVLLRPVRRRAVLETFE